MILEGEDLRVLIKLFLEDIMKHIYRGNLRNFVSRRNDEGREYWFPTKSDIVIEDGYRVKYFVYDEEHEFISEIDPQKEISECGELSIAAKAGNFFSEDDLYILRMEALLEYRSHFREPGVASFNNDFYEVTEGPLMKLIDAVN